MEVLFLHMRHNYLGGLFKTLAILVVKKTELANSFLRAVKV